MVPTIPLEIWMRTAEFIPSSILRNLHSVNSAFLHLALDKKYSDAYFIIRWDVRTAKYAKHLNQPHIAHRVRRLSLSSNWVESNVLHMEPSEEITKWTLLAWYLPFDLGRFIDPFIRRISNIKMCNTLMENTVLNFTNLSSLEIYEGSGSSSWTQPLPLIVNAYTACASNLRTLTLVAMCAGNLKVLFPPNASELTSLEEVKICFSPKNDCNADAEAASTFFRAIASTLTSLIITFGNTSDDPFRLLHNTTFPKLASFSLCQATLHSSALIQFLNQHADTLKHLSLQHTKSSLIASQSLLLPVLPYLESLNILNTSYWTREELSSWEDLDGIRAYVQHSLTTVSLMHCSFSLHDLNILLHLFGQESSGLKNLTVTVQVLSPQVLDMLAEKLPQLESLTIDFAYLRSTDVQVEGLGDLTQEDIESFLLEMKKRSYLRWAMRSFRIENMCLKAGTAMAILMPLTQCIPHLSEIDGAYVKMWREPGGSWKESNSIIDLPIAPW